MSDALLAAALLAYEADFCPDCGQPRDEAMDPLHDADHPQRTEEYVVSPPTRDHACTAMSRARKAIEESDIPHPDGLRLGISLLPVDR